MESDETDFPGIVVFLTFQGNHGTMGKENVLNREELSRYRKNVLMYRNVEPVIWDRPHMKKSWQPRKSW